jgi:hypothetical protein
VDCRLLHFLRATFHSPLLLKGRTRTTTLILPPPPGAILSFYPIHQGSSRNRQLARKWDRIVDGCDTSGDGPTPVRKLRKERDLGAMSQRCEV